jgi:hypothetical protein
MDGGFSRVVGGKRKAAPLRCYPAARSSYGGRPRSGRGI